MRKTCACIVPLVLTAAVAGCASHSSPDRVDDPYRVFMGIWHGMIFGFSLIGIIISWVASLFGIRILDDVTIFGQPSSGFSYYFGFVIGLCTLGGGGSRAR